MHNGVDFDARFGSHLNMSSPKSAVIVISSHVSRGTVGNRAAVFALESLGFPVWAVPTVMLPWHPGHGKATRIVPDNASFAALIADLGKARWLPEVGAIITGYLGDAAQADAIADLVKTVKAANPGTLYLCDPVIGDANGLYVPEATAISIRDKLLPLADVTTPNRFELAWLTGMPVTDNSDIMKAAQALGVQNTLVTTAHGMMTGSIGNLFLSPKAALLAEHRLVDGPSNGLGDLTSALFMSHLLLNENEERALKGTVASVFEVMARAAKRASDEIMLAEDANSLAHPMAMVQMRRLVMPVGKEPA
jgi:pyridoxine kinase